MFSEAKGVVSACVYTTLSMHTSFIYDRAISHEDHDMILFCTRPPLCAGVLWPMPAWVCRDDRSVYCFVFLKTPDGGDHKPSG